MKIILDIPCVMNEDGNIGKCTKKHAKQFSDILVKSIDNDEMGTFWRTKDGHIPDTSYKVIVEE